MLLEHCFNMLTYEVNSSERLIHFTLVSGRFVFIHLGIIWRRLNTKSFRNEFGN